MSKFTLKLKELLEEFQTLNYIYHQWVEIYTQVLKSNIELSTKKHHKLLKILLKIKIFFTYYYTLYSVASTKESKDDKYYLVYYNIFFKIIKLSNFTVQLKELLLSYEFNHEETHSLNFDHTLKECFNLSLLEALKEKGYLKREIVVKSYLSTPSTGLITFEDPKNPIPKKIKTRNYLRIYRLIKDIVNANDSETTLPSRFSYTKGYIINIRRINPSRQIKKWDSLLNKEIKEAVDTPESSNIKYKNIVVYSWVDHLNKDSLSIKEKLFKKTKLLKVLIEMYSSNK